MDDSTRFYLTEAGEAHIEEMASQCAYCGEAIGNHTNPCYPVHQVGLEGI